MKKQFVLLLAAAFWLTAFRSPYALEVGARLPKADIKMKDVSGKEVSLNDAKKTNGLLVMFSCNTCPYVARNQARTREICQYALKNNIGVILINSNEAERNGGDSYEAMQRYAKDQSYSWYYVVDKNNAVADAFSADRTPECYLFDKNAVLIYKGAIDDNPGNEAGVKQQYLLNAINAAVAGKKVEVTSTASVGCGIKRKM
ncbi:thioredoxin family protein [Chitinophaga sp. XS-30]|uniref:thioredoxin family protein n=1 Tax=Chitinophaga sp. XS-30 TaxID=2604421 RepID=UPI0011DCA505|nr:thioredoxin family protein [Chitinophaga sp. XS-30]QEH43126.1 thioredoxin family protein [Chitinophaga sp. XS-30]